jgi:two-component system nitrogen regulation sensor histidine kinase NtrY
VSDRSRRNLRWALALLGLIVLLTAVETWLQGNPAKLPVGGNILVWALVNVNVILLMALVLLVLRNLTKLYFERRRNVLGSRFRIRLTVAFVALASLPALLLFLVSLKLVTSSIQSWFDTQVEDSLKGAAELAADYYRQAEQTALHAARRVADEVAREGGAEPARLRILRGGISDFRLAAVEYYAPDGTAELRLLAPGPGTRLPPPLDAEQLSAARAGGPATHISAAPDGDLISAVVAVPGAAPPGRGAVVTSLLLPKELQGRLFSTTKTYESYQQLKLFQMPIRLSYTMTLGMIALLITFSATWFAFYLSRVITTPIQKLAEGTRRVAGGDLDFEITVNAQDEIGLLVSSFNQMTRDLRTNKAELEVAYHNLQRFNLELERRRDYILTILQNIASGVVSLDPAGMVTTCNRSAERMLGVPAADAVGRFCAAAFRDPALMPFREAIEALRQSGEETWEGKISLTAGAQLRTLVVNTVPLRGQRGEDLGRLIVFEDLTQLVKAQRVAAWREVARRIAHEIKNPLTPIQLSIQRARKKYLERSPEFDGVFLEAAATVLSQVEAMKRLLDEFTRFARLPMLNPAPVDLVEVIESALVLYRPERQGVHIATAYHDGPRVINADAEQLRRVFINLVENALTALDGPGTIGFETALLPDGRTVEVRVSDTGRGLPPEARDRLFLPYVSTKKEGAGLGLAIVSDIMNEHGGTIRVEDNEPRGTVFILAFPLHRDAAAPVGSTEVQHAG